jgi:hypothetical protein
VESHTGNTQLVFWPMLRERGGGVTYFLPMQSLGPTWNGCRAERSSEAKRGSPSQRSGRKDSGSVKLAEELYIARWEAATFVYGM